MFDTDLLGADIRSFQGNGRCRKGEHLWHPAGAPHQKAHMGRWRWGLPKKCERCGDNAWHWCSDAIGAEFDQMFVPARKG